MKTLKAAFLYRWSPVLVLCAIAVFLAAHLGGVLHESDQAAILSGAHELSTDSSAAAGASHYQYDKYYLTYWIVALGARLFPRQDLVAVGNLAAFALFWLPALAVAVHAVRRNIRSAGLFAATLLAPAVLVHTSFLSPNFISSGFLLLLLWAAGGGGAFRRTGIVATCFFAAVAARADAILLLPLLCWLFSPRATLRAMVTARRSWALAAAGGSALALGGWLQGVFSAGFYAPLWRPRVFLAYVVFGLGAALLLLLAALGRLLLAATRARASSVRRFAAFAPPALLLPFLFYAFQMCTTRHWMAGLMALAACTVSPRGRRWRCPPGARWRPGVFSGLVLVSAVLPLFVGVRLPSPASPRLCVTHPTYLPSADGLIPAGAYLWNARERRPGGVAHDHNQKLWRAARAVRNWPRDRDGAVRILKTPLSEIVAFAARRAGERPRWITETDAGGEPWSAELRALLRVGPSSTSDRIDDWRAIVIAQSLDRLGGDEVPHLVVGGAAGTPQGEQLEWLQLAALFGWREYRVLRSSGDPFDAQLKTWRGHTIAVLSNAPFSVELTRRDGIVLHRSTAPAVEAASEPAAADPVRRHVLVLPGRAWFTGAVRMHIADGETATIAVSTHPDYMTLP